MCLKLSFQPDSPLQYHLKPERLGIRGNRTISRLYEKYQQGRQHNGEVLLLLLPIMGLKKLERDDVNTTLMDETFTGEEQFGLCEARKLWMQYLSREKINKISEHYRKEAAEVRPCDEKRGGLCW